jgi:hypothetical protein
MIPVVKMIAYESRDPLRVFVAVPNEKGRYVLTDRCVAFVACPHCGSAQYEPCRSHTGGSRALVDPKYTAQTHYDRRHAGTEAIRQLRRKDQPVAYDDVIADQETP